MQRWMIGVLVILLGGCSASLKDYDNSVPAFQLEEYFSGHLTAWGIVQDYSGKMTRHFCVDINASWQEQDGQYTGTIDEHFIFDDGERTRRVWTLVRDASVATAYTGTAGDVVGTARGAENGHAFHWQYQLELPIKGDDGEVSLLVFDVDDWMYRIDQRRVFNRSTLNKLGVTLGEISLYFDKQAPVNTCALERETANLGIRNTTMPQVVKRPG